MDEPKFMKLYELARKLKAVGSLVEGYYVHLSSKTEDQELGWGIGALILDLADQLHKEAENFEKKIDLGVSL